MLRLSAFLSQPPMENSNIPRADAASLKSDLIGRHNRQRRRASSSEESSSSSDNSRHPLVIAPVDKAPYQRFGHAIASDGLAVFVNTNRNNVQGPLYKYCFASNSEDDAVEVIDQVAKLAMPPLDNRGYGLSFAVDRGHLLVGAKYDKANQGSVFVYYSDPSTCSGNGYGKELYKISSSDDGIKNFGSDIAMSYPYVVIGAPSDSTGVIEGGSAYLFKYSSSTTTTNQITSTDDAQGGSSTSADTAATLIQVAKLMPEVLTPFSNYGTSVQISSSWIVVTAPSYFEFAGSAFIYANDGVWNSFTVLKPDEGSSISSFGSSSALTGNFAYFSATNEDTSGAVYAFSYKNKQWAKVGILLPPVSQFKDGFGTSIYSMLDSTGSVAIAFVGAPNIHEAAEGSTKCSVGEVYAFGVSKTSEYLGSLRSESTTINDDGDDSVCDNDAFGSSLGYIDNGDGLDFLLVGAELASSDHFGKTGKVYVESHLAHLYFEQYDLMTQSPSDPNPNTNDGSNSNSMSIFGTSISYSILVLVAVLCALPLVVMTSFLVKRVVARARESRVSLSSSDNNSSDYQHRSGESDPVNVKMETSDDDFEAERGLNLSGLDISRQGGYPALKTRVSQWISGVFFSRNSTDFTSIPADNDNSACSAELGEIHSNEECNRLSKNEGTRNLVFSTSTFSPITPIVKYDSARSANDA